MKNVTDTKTFLSTLVSKHSEFVFISPHQDDAALSCGTLMRELRQKKKTITVINVFTKAHTGPYTLSAKKFLQLSGGYTNAEKLYRERRKEDSHALAEYHAKVINLDLVDALFRRKSNAPQWLRFLPELTHLYPIYRIHIKNAFSKQDPALPEVVKKLTEHIPAGAVVFAPFNVANHVDHMLAKTGAEIVCKELVYYADFPYNLYTREAKLPRTLKKVILPAHLESKQKVASLYATQFTGLFPGKVIPPHNEVFFIMDSLIKKRRRVVGIKSQLTVFLSSLSVRLLDDSVLNLKEFLGVL